MFNYINAVIRFIDSIHCKLFRKPEDGNNLCKQDDYYDGEPVGEC